GALLLGALVGGGGGNGPPPIREDGTTVSANLGGRDIVASSPNSRGIYVGCDPGHAGFKWEEAWIPAGQGETSWGANNTVSLPAQWRRMRLICVDKTIDVELDGKSFRQINL